MQTGDASQSGGGEAVFAFGPYSLLTERHLLLKGEQPVSIGSRAVEILMALLERAGELVSKDELFARAWPNMAVDESNLRAQVAVLRKALCDEGSDTSYIAAVPGRGYRFIGRTSHAGLGTVSREPARKNNLPGRLTPVVGRADVVSAMSTRLARCRFVTIVGPGGIGKTTVAIATAAQISERFRDGICYLDSTPLVDANLLPNLLASTLGLSIIAHDVAAELTLLLREKRLLIVFDNCERIANPVAALCETILKAAPEIYILTTSREPLRAEGESVHRLSPLETPPAIAGLSAEHALGFPAVKLFVERAAARIHGFELSNDDAPVVADICRQLDGNALAIELAAGRVDAFGTRGIAERLNDRLRLLTGGRRTALPRHQALAATLDWSYDALADIEKTLLRRLSVFAGGFTLESASAVASGDAIEASDVSELLADLVAKSLVSAEVGGAMPRYRLLETTRFYALAKLDNSGERTSISRRHAEHFREVFERKFAEWTAETGADCEARYGREIDNIRAALDWSFSSGGDTELGMALTLGAIPLWFQLSSTDECRNRVQHALASIDLGEARGAYARQIMQLYVTLGLSRTFTIGLAPQALAAWAKAFEIAEELGDREYQLEALWGVWFCQIGAAEYRTALDTAEKFSGLAERTADRRLADRLTGVPLHCLGRHVMARRRIEKVLEGGEAPVKPPPGIRFRFGQPMAAQVILAQMLWLQGSADQAIAAARGGLEDARAAGHAISVCDALAQASCPIALLIGDWAGAGQAVESLLNHAEAHALGPWSVLGRCWKGALQIKTGALDPGIAQLAAGLEELREVRFAFYRTSFMGMLAEGLAELGQIRRASALVDEALDRCKRKEELWCLAELLRTKGEIALLTGTSTRDVAEAKQLFSRALKLARRQRALAWELRAAVSLARLQKIQGLTNEPRGLLAGVFQRLTEGFSTRDAVAAKALMEQLS